MGTVKRCSMTLNEELLSFFSYLKGNKLLCGIVLFAALFAYGFPLTQFTLSIDEEKALFRSFSDTISGWSAQGRFGISISKILFHNWQNNSITATFLAVSGLWLTSIMWAYVLRSFIITNKKSVSFDFPGLALALMFLTFPAHSENIGFSVMSFELGIGWIMISASSILITKWAILKKDKSYMVIGVLFLVFATSIYQAFLPVFICGVLLITMIYLISLQKSSVNINLKDYLIIILKYISIAILSLLIYKIIDKMISVFYPKSDYIEGFFSWGKENPIIITLRLLSNFKSLVMGDLIYGSSIILPSIIVSVLILFIYIYNVITKAETKNTASIIVVLLIGFIISPFLMSILLGSPMPIRANFVLALFISSIWYVLYLIVEKKILRNIIIILVLMTTFYQSQSMAQLFYSDYNRYQEDVNLANQIGYRILDLDLGEAPSNPVIFVGTHTQMQRGNIIKQEVLGYSFFEWDGGNPTRKAYFMRSIGYEYIMPTEEEKEKAIKIANSMPVWPHNGSVALVDDLIIVNLSESPNRYDLNLFYDGENSSTNKKDEVYNLKLNNNIDYSFDLEIENADNSNLILKAGNVDPQISISLEQKLEKDAFEYISFEIESDIEGDMQIFLLQENETYSQKYSGFIKLKRGINKIYCERQKWMNNVIALRIDPPNQSVIEVKKIKFEK